MNKFHLYQQRHLFLDEEYLGKYDIPSRSVRLREEFAVHADTVKAWFMRTQGLAVTLLIGNEASTVGVRLRDFPDAVCCLLDPELGDLSPVAVEHARAHFTREEFENRYRGRADYDSKPARKPKADS